MSIHTLIPQITPYIKAHAQTTVVFFITGAAFASSNFSGLMQEIKLAHALGMRCILVCGARLQIDAAMQAAGKTFTMHANRRITSADDMPLIAQVVTALRLRVQQEFSKAASTPPYASNDQLVVWGNTVIARPIGIINGVDFQHSGRVRTVQHAAINKLLDAGCIVALDPLMASRTGLLYNLSTAAIVLAMVKLTAVDKLVVCAEIGKLRSKGELGNWSRAAVRQAAATAPPAHAALLELMYTASKNVRVHCIDCHESGALLNELYTRDGSGIMIDDEYQQVIQAQQTDIADLMQLLIDPMEQEEMRYRDASEIESLLKYFWLLQRDKKTIACAALKPFGQQQAEIFCFTVAPDYRSQGIGRELLHAVEQQARQVGQARQVVNVQVFLYTSQTKEWYCEQGYEHVGNDILPAGHSYDATRGSSILRKILR